MQIVKSVITNVLTALYTPFWFSLLLSVLFMFVYKQYPNVKAAWKQWLRWFTTEPEFRRMFVLVFYVTMILFRTLLNRNMWQNPVSNVIGVFGLYKESNGERVLTTEVLENLALFVPFAFLLLWVYGNRLLRNSTLKETVLKSAWISFVFSFAIEMLQLFLRLGTWQLSDLFYNTLGGAVGGLLYWLWHDFGWKKVNKKDP